MKRTIVLLIALAVVGIPAAHARPITPPNRYAVARIVHGERTTTISVRRAEQLTATALPRTGWCENVHVWDRALSLPGEWLWTFHQRLIWCHTVLPDPRGSIVTLNLAGHGPDVANWATLPAWSPWDYDGVVGSRNNGGVGESFVYRWRQGKFKVCIAKVIVCQTKLPWLEIRGNGNGTHTSDGGW